MYKLVTWEKAIEAIDKNKPVLLDTETIGLYGKIRLFQFYQEGWEAVLIVDVEDYSTLNNTKSYDIVDTIIAYKQLIDLHLVGHNIAYDLSTIQKTTGLTIQPKKLDDTLYLSRLYFKNNKSFSLDVMLDQIGWQSPDVNKKEMQKSDWSAALTKEQLKYAANDVRGLAELYKIVKAIPIQSEYDYDLDIKSLLLALQWQKNGFSVDQDIVQEQYTNNINRVKEIDLPINCNSYQQVRKYLGVDRSTDIDLAEFSLSNDIELADKAKAVRETRKLLKQNNFLIKYDKPKIYGFFQPGAKSGRFTSKEQNLQQIPRALKKLFTPQNDDVLVYSDFSQLELRCCAIVTGDAVLEKSYKEDIDLHTYVAQKIFETEKPTKEQRQIAKTCNFGLLYGAGNGVLRKILLQTSGITLSENEALKIIRAWKNTFKGIAAWQNQMIRNFNAKRPAETLTGRVYGAHLVTDYLNIAVQGTGATIAKLANIYMEEEFKHLATINEVFKGYKKWQVNFIHDSYLFEVPNPGIAEIVMKVIGDSMLKAWKHVSQFSNSKIKDLPMPVNVYAGYNWQDIEDGGFFAEYILEGKV